MCARYYYFWEYKAFPAPWQPRFETQTVAQAQKEFSVDRISNLTPSCRMDRVRDPDDWGLSGLRHFVVTIRN